MINISIRQLEIFETVAQTESFTRASKVLNMTQPAVSMQIKQLEVITEIPLFERHGKKIILTDIGHDMQSYAGSILTQFRNMQQALEELQSVHQGYLKVSAATTTNHFITHMLASFSRKHPAIKIALDITNRESLVKQLHAYEPDLVIMGEPPATLELESDIIMANPLVMISNPDHPLAEQSNIPLESVMTEVFVTREEGSGTRSAIERHLAIHNLSFSQSFEMGSNEAIKHSVVAGLGLGLVSLHTIKMELEAKKLTILDVDGLPIMRDWHIVTRNGKRLSPAAKAFKKHILKEAADYIKSYHQVTPEIKTSVKLG